MSTATLPHAPALPSRLLRMFGNIFGGVSDGFAMARRYDRLTRMSASELAALGLSREDIPGAAINGIKHR